LLLAVEKMKSSNFGRAVLALAGAAVLAASAAQAASDGPAAQVASKPPAAGEHGMVVTAQHLATKVGVQVLKDGGNAVDAAVAVGYALAVVYPAAGNLGGGGFMTVQMADGRKTFIDFREKAPLAAKADMYLDAAGRVMPNASLVGQLAVGVPGTVAGLELAREHYGSQPRTALVAPAQRLAEQGFVLERGDAEMLHEATRAFRRDPVLGAIFLRHGAPFEAGHRLVQKDLARTLARIAAQGVDGFYKGPVAAAIVASSHAGGGIITQADLDQYQARERAPIECDYRGLHIVSAPPPSSGGIVLCETLNILSGYPLHAMGWHSAPAMQVQIEAMRHAYADRNTYLGDPDFVSNPVQRLLDPDYAARVRATIRPDRAGVSQDIRPGAPAHEGSNTTHYSIVDRWGNAVAVTYTLNGWFGAEVMAAGTGVLLNDEMDDFTSKEGEPNGYGLVQGEANAIAPGKRPLSSMSPTIVTRAGRPLMVLGTPGGSHIPTATLLTFLNVVDYGMDIQQAVDAPRFHQQWLPEATELEPNALSAEVQKQLERWGQQFELTEPRNHLAAILVGAPRLDGKPVGKAIYYGANDPRRGTGLALGY